ncbi:unnamed protein product [Laminaria digitata]
MYQQRGFLQATAGRSLGVHWRLQQRGPTYRDCRKPITLMPEAAKLQVEPNKSTSGSVPPVVMMSKSRVKRDQATTISRTTTGIFAPSSPISSTGR